MPSLYNGTIAWTGHIGTNSEIFFWDGTATHRITNSPGPDDSPSLYNGTIAWKGVVDGVGSEIFYWDGTFTSSPPTAQTGIDQSVTICDTVTLDGTSSSDPDGTLVSWDWLIEYQGDASKNMTTTGETATVNDLTLGTYDVTLTVTDNDDESAIDTMLLEVTEGVPWDVNDDCRRGLAEVISILQELTEQ